MSSSDLSGRVSVSPVTGSAEASIAESDPITVEVTGPAAVAEGDTTSEYTVALTPAGVVPTADLTVDWATGGGTATAGTDYTAGSATLTFTPDSAGPQTFTVATLDDSVDEPGETFEVTLSNPSGGGGPAPTPGFGQDDRHHNHRRRRRHPDRGDADGGPLDAWRSPRQRPTSW